MDHYHVTLEGFPADSGHVITKDGEIIGGYMIGPVCREISEWHEAQ